VKILVTGANGMLGTALVEVLSENHEVTGVDIGEADIRIRKEVEELVLGTGPELVVHAAANTDVDGCELDERSAYLTNGIGTGNVALACARVGAICMYVSTDFVFDGEKKGPYDEFDAPNPINVYGKSKYMGEVLLARALPRHYIVRTEWLYGRKGKNFVDEIIKRAVSSGKLKVVDDQVGSPTYALDLARMMAAMLEKMPPFGIYHLTNAGSCTWYEFALEILSVAGLSSVPVERTSQEEIGRPARRPRNSVMRNLLYELEGFPPARHWREALLDYMRTVHAKRTNLAGTSIENRETEAGN